MNINEIAGKAEAIIFAGGEPVSAERLSQVLNVSPDDLSGAIEKLKEKYNAPESGINLVILDGSLQFCTNPAYIEPVRAALDLKKNTPLSQAALEVLSVIAYNQPVTKAFVEQVRGVDCSGVVGSLVQKGLVEERGRMELPGRPLLYGTTENFLRCFGITSIDELPPVEYDDASEKAEAEDDYSADEIEAAVLNEPPQ